MTRLIAALLALVAIATTAHAQPLAVYKGNSYTGRAAVPAFETFMGRRVDLVGDFIDFSSRTAFNNDVGFTADGWKGYDRPLILAVPVLCRGETFADIAAGKHDASYVRLAQLFNAASVKIAAIRLGWEDNIQTTTPGYASQDSAANFANYRAARRHLYALLKPLLPDTLILQDVAFGWQQVQLTQIWDPASADGLGLTVYPQTWSSFTTEPGFTKNLMEESWGLKGFGSWPNVPIFITEYGATGTRADGHGAPNKGDDPAWTSATTALFKSWGARVKGVVVWDYHASDFNGLVSAGGFPNAGAALKAAFAPAPVTPTAPPPPSPPPAQITAYVSDGGKASAVTNADGSAILTVTFPPTPAAHSYTIWLFANGKSVTRKVETWGSFSQLGWSTKGGVATMHVGAK